MDRAFKPMLKEAANCILIGGEIKGIWRKNRRFFKLSARRFWNQKKSAPPNCKPLFILVIYYTK